MDIDLIVAASGNPPDATTNMMGGVYQPYHGAGSFGTASMISMSPHSMSHSLLAGHEEPPLYHQYGTSPQSLPSGFGVGSVGSHSHSTAMAQPTLEPTRPYKRAKRNSSASGASGATLTHSSSSASTNTTTSATSQTGSMESMMFGWKLTKPPKDAGMGDGTSEPPRKRSKSARSGSGSGASPRSAINHNGGNSNAPQTSPGVAPPRLPYTSPMHHSPHHRSGYVPPGGATFSVYDPRARAAAEAHLQSMAEARLQSMNALNPASMSGISAGAPNALNNPFGTAPNAMNSGVLPSAVPAYLTMAQMGTSTSTSPSDYASVLMDAASASSPHSAHALYQSPTYSSTAYQSPPVPSGFDHFARASPYGHVDFVTYDLPAGVYGTSSGLSAPSLPGGVLPANFPLNTLHSTSPLTSSNPLSPSGLQGFQSGYHSPTTAGSPRTPTFGLSPLSITPLAASAPASSPLSTNIPNNGIAHSSTFAQPTTPNSLGSSAHFERPTVGLPGSNGTSAFQVVTPRRTSNPDIKGQDKSAAHSPPHSPSVSSTKKHTKKVRDSTRA